MTPAMFNLFEPNALINYVVTERIPEAVLNFMTGLGLTETWQFLITLNIFLLIVGCLMDIFSATIVVVPLIVPIAQGYGVDLVHLGIIFLTNLEIGYSTPPVGINFIPP